VATIDIAHDHLHVGLKWYEKVLAWHGSVSVPLLHIASAEAGAEIPEDVGAGGQFHGTYVPGSRVEGTEDLPDGSHCFFDVRDPTKAVTINLAHDTYKCIVVEVDGREPKEVAEWIMNEVHAARKRAGKE
jgi:hypothetical protein